MNPKEVLDPFHRLDFLGLSLDLRPLTLWASLVFSYRYLRVNP